MFILGHTPSFFVLLCLASFFGFFGTLPDPSPVLARILLVSRYSPGPFFDTRPDPFPILTWILPNSRYSLRPFSSTPLDSTLFRYSVRPFFDIHQDSTSFLVLALTLFRYSPGFHPFSVLTRPFSDTHPNSTPFRYSPKYDLFSGLMPRFP